MHAFWHTFLRVLASTYSREATAVIIIRNGSIIQKNSLCSHSLFHLPALGNHGRVFCPYSFCLTEITHHIMLSASGFFTSQIAFGAQLGHCVVPFPRWLILCSVDVPQFTPFPNWTCLCCFCVLAMNKTSVDIYIQSFFMCADIHFYFSRLNT